MAHMQRPYTASSWTVQAMLADGFGIEDIALKLGVTAGSVRKQVNAWRANGNLPAILAKRAPTCTA